MELQHDENKNPQFGQHQNVQGEITRISDCCTAVAVKEPIGAHHHPRLNLFALAALCV